LIGKKIVVDTVEEVTAAALEYKYTEDLNEIWEPENSKIENMPHDELIDTLAKYEIIFAQASENRELKIAIVHRMQRISPELYTQEEVDKRKEELKQK